MLVGPEYSVRWFTVKCHWEPLPLPPFCLPCLYRTPSRGTPIKSQNLQSLGRLRRFFSASDKKCHGGVKNFCIIFLPKTNSYYTWRWISSFIDVKSRVYCVLIVLVNKKEYTKCKFLFFLLLLERYLRRLVMTVFLKFWNNRNGDETYEIKRDHRDRTSNFRNIV